MRVRVKHRRRLLVVATLAITAANGRPARAHPEISPLLANRYLSFTVTGGRLAVSYAILLGNLPGGEARRRIDSDGDGRLSPLEIESEKRRLLAQAATLFTVSIDGRPIALPLRATVQLGGDESAGAAPMVEELGALVPLAPGPHRARVEALAEPRRLGETEIAIDLGPGSTLTEAFAGSGSGLRGSRFKWQGPRVSTIEDRSATFAWTMGAAAPGEPRRPRWVVPLIVAVMALDAPIVLLVLRRRRSRKS